MVKFGGFLLTKTFKVKQQKITKCWSWSWSGLDLVFVLEFIFANFWSSLGLGIGMEIGLCQVLVLEFIFILTSALVLF